ncbi:hypothetical protein ZWY2020_012077 [Hordeum vulgare]|nr:hypothetical protein ZWY2020_012077 [Hordeum vulgare]
MAGRLAAMPEETTDGSPAACPPTNLYRDSIRMVPLPRGQYIRSTLFAHSGQSGSSFSGASSYYPTSGSGCSWGPGWASAPTNALAFISNRMVSDGYTQRMHGPSIRFRDMPASSLQDMVGRWTPALTVIVFNIRNLMVAVHKMPPVTVARFGKASISAMLVFVDLILAVPGAETLRAVDPW